MEKRAILFQQEVLWHTTETKEVFSTLVKSTLGADPTQFQFFLRKIGAPSCLFRDSLLVQRMFRAVDQLSSNHVTWHDCEKFLSAISDGDRDAQLQYRGELLVLQGNKMLTTDVDGFRVFNMADTGKGISAKEMKEILPRVCKAIFRASGMQLARPFNNAQNLTDFIDKLFLRIERAGQDVLDAEEYSNLAAANETMCSLFTLGCFVPGDRTAAPAVKVSRPEGTGDALQAAPPASKGLSSSAPMPAGSASPSVKSFAGRRNMFESASKGDGPITPVKKSGSRLSQKVTSPAPQATARSETPKGTAPPAATAASIASPTRLEGGDSESSLSGLGASDDVDLSEILTEVEVLHSRLKRRDEEIEELTRKVHVLEASQAPSGTKAEESDKIEKLSDQLRKYQARVKKLQAQLDDANEHNRELTVQNRKLTSKVKDQAAKLRKSADHTPEKGGCVLSSADKQRFDGEVTNYHTLLMWLLNLDTSLVLDASAEANTDVGAFRRANSTETIPPTPGGVVKMAMLGKQGGFMERSWKKRFFVLRSDGQLIYYADTDAPKPRGSIDIHSVQQFAKGGEDALPNTIGLICNGKDMFISFDSQQQMNEWITAFKQMMTRKDEVKPRPR